MNEKAAAVLELYLAALEYQMRNVRGMKIKTRQWHLSDDEQRVIHRLIDEGRSTGTIQKLMGISAQTVLNYRRRQGVSGI